jgi:hypothetical protein
VKGDEGSDPRGDAPHWWWHMPPRARRPSPNRTPLLFALRPAATSSPSFSLASSRRMIRPPPHRHHHRFRSPPRTPPSPHLHCSLLSHRPGVSAPRSISPTLTLVARSGRLAWGRRNRASSPLFALSHRLHCPRRAHQLKLQPPPQSCRHGVARSDWLSEVGTSWAAPPHSVSSHCLHCPWLARHLKIRLPPPSRCHGDARSRWFVGGRMRLALPPPSASICHPRHPRVCHLRFPRALGRSERRGTLAVRSRFLQEAKASRQHSQTPPVHAAAPTLVAIGSVPRVCATVPDSSPPLAAADLPLPPAALIPSIEEPSVEDSFPTSEIRLHITINVVSRLNSMEEARSLSVEEQSLHEFLLDQILFLQELLEPWLVPRTIEELLGCEKVASPPLDEGIPSPPAARGRGGGKVVRGTVPTLVPPLVGASVVVRQPAEEQALLSSSRELVTRSSLVRVTMIQCISYTQCHEKVVKSFKTRPSELVVLGPSVFSHRHDRLSAKGHGGTINPKPVVPNRRLHSKRVLRRHLVHPRSCSMRPLLTGASSPASPGRRLKGLGSFLPSAWDKVVDALLGRVRYRE